MKKIVISIFLVFVSVVSFAGPPQIYYGGGSGGGGGGTIADGTEEGQSTYWDSAGGSWEPTSKILWDDSSSILGVSGKLWVNSAGNPLISANLAGSNLYSQGKIRAGRADTGVDGFVEMSADGGYRTFRGDSTLYIATLSGDVVLDPFSGIARTERFFVCGSITGQYPGEPLQALRRKDSGSEFFMDIIKINAYNNNKAGSGGYGGALSFEVDSQKYANITGYAIDETATVEVGELHFYVMDAGTITKIVEFKPDAAYFQKIISTSTTDAQAELRYDASNKVLLTSDSSGNLTVSPTGSGVTIGDGTAGVDYALTFDGETNDGKITYDEDNDLIDFDCSLTFSSGYTRHIDIVAGAAQLGPTAPDRVITGTFSGLGFDADAEQAFFNFEVPEDWNGASDMQLEIIWHSESGTAIADTETVKWDAEYRSRQPSEAVDSGTSVTATAIYTQSGAGTDKELFETDITLDYDDVNQPLAAGDSVGVLLTRDVTGDTYGGDAIAIRFEIKYTADKMPYQ